MTVAILFWALPVKSQAPIEPCDLSTTEGRQCYIALESAKRGVDPYLLVETIRGESQFTPYVHGDSGAACGMTQYHAPTFERHKKRAIAQGEPFDDFTYCNPRDEVRLMAWAFTQGEAYRREWTAYRNL